jgi:hypothetical protein
MWGEDGKEVERGVEVKICCGLGFNGVCLLLQTPSLAFVQESSSFPQGDGNTWTLG